MMAVREGIGRGTGMTHKNIVTSVKLTDGCTCRPINDRGERVAPSDLLEYRRFHKFRGPECMCAIDDAVDNATSETAIFVSSAGKFAGEYVAACAASVCGYIGEMICRASSA